MYSLKVKTEIKWKCEEVWLQEMAFQVRQTCACCKPCETLLWKVDVTLGGKELGFHLLL
jgi:hypothetical protein